MIIPLISIILTYTLCHKAGEIPICEYAKQKADRDILVKLVVKKKPIQVKYLAQRHAKTDFPMLTCAVSNMEGKWTAVLGARPMKAMEVAIPEDYADIVANLRMKLFEKIKTIYYIVTKEINL